MPFKNSRAGLRRVVHQVIRYPVSTLMFQRLAGTKPSTLGIATAIPQASCQVLLWFREPAPGHSTLGAGLQQLQPANGESTALGSGEKALEMSGQCGEDPEFEFV